MASLKAPDFLQLINGYTAEGKAFYAYIAMDSAAYQNLQEKWSRGEKIDLTQAGEIIETGWGRYPDAATIDRMKRDHNAQENFMDILDNL